MEQIITHAIDTTRDISIAYIDYLYFYEWIENITPALVFGVFFVGLFIIGFRLTEKWPE